MQVLNLDEPETMYVKALIYGKPGTGKTTFGVSAPKPLILLTELQAKTHIKHAMQRGSGRPIGVLHTADIEDFQCVAQALRNATLNPSLKSKPFVVKRKSGEVIFQSDVWPESIVIDSLTDVCTLIERDIDRISPPKDGKDGLPVKAERFWMVLRDRAEKFIRAFRDVDFHVIYLCLEDDRMVGEEPDQTRVVQPAMPMRALPNAIAAAVNVVGIMVRDIQRVSGEEAKVRFGVRTVGPSTHLLKPCRPLEDFEVPDFTSWVTRLNAAINDPNYEQNLAAEKAAKKNAKKQNAQSATKES